jgi:hypothetical protein
MDSLITLLISVVIGLHAEDRLLSLILGSESIRNLRGLCLFIFRLYLTIGKEIRSNNLSPAIRFRLMNNVKTSRLNLRLPVKNQLIF